MTRSGKERRPKKRKVYCAFCDEKVTLNKKSCCSKCGAVIIID